MTKAYVCVFVLLTVKAIHLELVFYLTTDAFLSALRRFITRRGKPKLLWRDHGTNFIGVHKELKQLAEFLRLRMQFLSSVHLRRSLGNSFQRDRPILVVYGNHA